MDGSECRLADFEARQPTIEPPAVPVDEHDLRDMDCLVHQDVE